MSKLGNRIKMAGIIIGVIAAIVAFFATVMYFDGENIGAVAGLGVGGVAFFLNFLPFYMLGVFVSIRDHLYSVDKHLRAIRLRDLRKVHAKGGDFDVEGRCYDPDCTECG